MFVRVFVSFVCGSTRHVRFVDLKRTNRTHKTSLPKRVERAFGEGNVFSLRVVCCFFPSQHDRLVGGMQESVDCIAHSHTSVVYVTAAGKVVSVKLSGLFCLHTRLYHALSSLCSFVSR